MSGNTTVKILFHLLVCLGFCCANGIPQHMGMGVIYVVPAAMALTVLVSLVVILGMMCLNRGAPEPQVQGMETVVPVSVVTEFGGDGVKPETSVNAGKGKSGDDGYTEISEVAGKGDGGDDSGGDGGRVQLKA